MPSLSLTTAAVAVFLLLVGQTSGQSTTQPSAIRVHDPRIVREKDTYYLFSTGLGIPQWQSTDLTHWSSLGPVFTAPPAWTTAEFPAGNYLWAPDVSYFGGQYHLYFAASHFGKNDSGIGLATNVSLDAHRADNHWVDQGVVFRTHVGDRYNAIDPAVFLDTDGTPWMVMGSFWNGIQLAKLNVETGKAIADEPVIGLARRHAPDAIEAGCLLHHGDYYYCFASFDYCCRGVLSTYRIMVGRSRSLSGPYVDFDGRPMLDGGGTLVLASTGDIRGPGHCGIFHNGSDDLLVHHFYNAADDGRSELQVRPLLWPKDNWPLAGEPINVDQPTTTPTTNPSVAGVWRFALDFADPVSVTFSADGTTRPDMGHWQMHDQQLTIMSSRRRTPRPALTCFVDPSGKTFIGRNNEGAIVRGVRSPD